MMGNIKRSKNSEGPLRPEGESLMKDKHGWRIPPRSCFRPPWRRCDCIPLDGKEISWVAKYSESGSGTIDLTAEINGIHIRKVQEIALYGTKKPRLMGRHTEKAGIPLATCGLEHTVCHQEGLSKVVTGSRSSLWGLQEPACSGAQLILSITECFHIHISHRPWSKNKKKQNAAINQKRSQEEKPLSSSSALY